MVIGVGIDIIKINKIKKAIDKWRDGFIQKIFNAEEIQHIGKNKLYYQRLAARFAAKEAVIKAISKKHLLSFKDIVILNKENGAPYCLFKEDIRIKIFISITHIEDYAVACAVAEEAC